MMPTDDGYAREVIHVVRDLTMRVDQYETNSSADRANFKATIEAGLVDLRRDFNKALAPAQLDNIDHRRAHDADRIERSNRTMVVNLWMGILTGLCILNLGLIVYLVARLP